jgi:hypothetical protein
VQQKEADAAARGQVPGSADLRPPRQAESPPR